ncbi:hypothetical protein ALP33_200168 [Pseudomonas amygdali pv. lachrymans]|uniref:Uncharacterized protein n=1 Tax=Pseudomonas amygdali pv. lachrymans TaxID=53707 RepID=A0AB37R048_PSEAV|nr:hypothetical protein ALP33_200168 [Pseudomonas amygdali pv. lachrymans]
MTRLSRVQHGVRREVCIHRYGIPIVRASGSFANLGMDQCVERTVVMRSRLPGHVADNVSGTCLQNVNSGRACQAVVAQESLMILGER